jgi:hypothetical protein
MHHVAQFVAFAAGVIIAVPLISETPFHHWFTYAAIGTAAAYAVALVMRNFH